MEWITKQDPYICRRQETHFRWKDTHRPKVKGWNKIFCKTETNKPKAVVAILIPDKIDFKIKGYNKRQRRT